MVCKDFEINITRQSYDAVLFDLDGVLTKTAKAHAASWKKLFDEFLQRRAAGKGSAWTPFDIESDYLKYVDGKPRYEGVKSFLQSRGIDLPYGKVGDPPERETICGLGNRKNRIFQEHLTSHGVESFGPAVTFLRRLRKKGFRTAVVSSSKNCTAVLKAAGLLELFDARVDGLESEKLGLRGKPHPDIFLEAAKRLGVVSERAVVLEDALSGVEAGRRGNFGCVVGVDRVGQSDALKEHGADIVVKDFSHVAVESVCGPMERPVDSLPSAFESMGEIRESAGADRIMVALDYDGTLTPIVKRPELAVLSDEMRRTVADLAELCTVAVISGRDLSDVKGLVDIESVFYAGSHGFDISGPQNLHLVSQQGTEFLPVLDRAQEALNEILNDVPGALIERKKFSIAVHYRLVAGDLIPAVEQAVDRVLDDHPGLRKGLGKKVFELQPDVDWNKGKALLWLLDALDLDRTGVLPLYFGDDVTDEDAFKVLQDCGIGIVVRDRGSLESRPESAARYALEDPEEVRRFLQDLIEMLRERRG